MKNIVKAFIFEVKAVTSKMTKVTKVISVISLLFSILFASYVSWIYFTPDEELLTEVVELLKPKQKITDAENIAVYGLGIRAEIDPLKAGQTIVAAYEEAIRQRAIKESSDIKSPKDYSYLGVQPLSKLNWDDKVCELTASKCLKKFQSLEKEFTQTQRDNIELLSRYENLNSIPNFQFPLPIDIAISDNSLSDIAKIGSYKLVGIAVDVSFSDKSNEALRSFEKESKLWRRLLAQSTTLVSKMISARVVREQIRLASEIISNYPELANAKSELLARIISPLSAKELGLEAVLAYEFKTTASVIENTFNYVQLKNPDMNSEHPFFMVKRIGLKGFKLNASLNQAYKIHDFHTYLLIQNKKQTFGLMNKFKILDTTNENNLIWLFSSNPIGGYLNSFNGNYSNYFLRLHDLDAYARLVETQRQITLQKIAKKDIPAFLSTLDSNLNAPYLEAPMTWNAETSTLSVQSKATFTTKQAPAEVKFD
jgi:hypothetical protein